MTLHEPLVAITDLALSVLALYCAYQLWALHATRARIFTVQFLFLSAASLFGAVFHAYFPLKDGTPFGLFVWILVCASIGGVGYTMILGMSDTQSARIQRIVRIISMLAVFVFLGYIIFVKRTYDVVLMFYAPILGVYFLYSLWQVYLNRIWCYASFGLFLSIMAGVVQGSGMKLGVLDHNTMYHIVQALSLSILCYGYIRVLRSRRP